MKWLNGDRMRMVLVGVVAVIVLGGGNANADFTFGESTNLGPAVNSSSSEYGLSISADGLSLFFDSDRPDMGTYDIYVSTRETTADNWGPAVSVGPNINIERSQACPSVSVDGLELFLSSPFWQSGWTQFGGADLWVSRRSSVMDPWSVPESLGAVVNTASHDTEPSISADGLSLYFGSDRSGDSDIWVTTRPTKNDPWTEPVKLELTVNSGGAWTPSISADGLALFFGSERAGGYGKIDMWVSTRPTTDDAWGEPVNLGPSINTPYLELVPCISRDGSSLYFTAGFDIRQSPIIPICDFNGDGSIDTDDLVIMVDSWGTSETLCDIGPMPWGNGVVDTEDLQVFIKYWEQENILENPQDN